MASPQPSRLHVVSPASTSKAISTRRVTSPITPVTGIIFPSPEPSPIEPPPATNTRRHRPIRRMSRIDSTSSSSNRNFVEISSDISSPPQIDDAEALDDLWNSLRLQKGLKMDKERPKVKSLEDYKPTAIIDEIIRTTPSPRPPSIRDPTPARESPVPSAPSARTPEKRSLLEDVLGNDRDSLSRTPSPMPVTTLSPIPPKALKRKKSITVFRTSLDKNYVVAIFDLRGVDKDDIRVTFRRDHIMVSWEKWEVENWEEEDCIARRTVERVYHRVIPLAEGTKFRDVYGTMKGNDLLLRYPLVGINGSRSRES